MDLRAILVSVDYSDLLSVTLPYNRHHFSEVMVVTSLADDKTYKLSESLDCLVFATNLFYADGAVFNKWLALETALDIYGRSDWLCIMDADVLWPKKVDLASYEAGKLYTPRRRMMYDETKPIPEEKDWLKFPMHPQQAEFAGYTQIFHASDAALGSPPWHEINWKHAGGADSFFQMKWAPENKIRPNFEVLHLGDAGKNWCGRATKYRDGSIHPDSAKRIAKVREFVRSRRSGPTRFDAEKIL